LRSRRTFADATTDPTDLGRLLSGTVPHADGRVAFALNGEVNISNAERLLERLVEISAPHGHRLDLDLADVGFLDSTGLRALLKVATLLAASDGELRVLRPSPPVVQLVRLTETERMLGLARPSGS
jgi:anti-sigma B factor antagonist